ncbi:MAG: hypothetical protein C4343_01030 [Chloroflexota bacterium]
MDIRRFGVGYRRPQGPAGSVGLTGGPIHADEHGRIAELVLARHGRLELHSAPMPAWLLVIEGGGWVQVGDERARIAAGEAVWWPADVVRGLWTEGSELRAFIVEFGTGGVVEASVGPVNAGRLRPVRVVDRVVPRQSALAPGADEGEPY